MSLPPQPHAPLPVLSLLGEPTGKVQGGCFTHPLVVHVGQDPRHQLNKEDRQQQAEILGARREGGHGRVKPGQAAGPSGPLTNASPKLRGAPITHSFFLLFPAALDGGPDTRLSRLLAWSSPLHPSCTGLLSVH